MGETTILNVFGIPSKISSLSESEKCWPTSAMIWQLSVLGTLELESLLVWLPLLFWNANTRRLAVFLPIPSLDAVWDQTNKSLKYAKWNGSGWFTETVDASGESTGAYPSIAVDKKLQFLGSDAASFWLYVLPKNQKSLA